MFLIMKITKITFAKKINKFAGIALLKHLSIHYFFSAPVLLILASQRIEVVIAEWFQNEKLKEWLSHDVTVKRGSTPTMVEWAILAWVAGKKITSQCDQRF